MMRKWVHLHFAAVILLLSSGARCFKGPSQMAINVKAHKETFWNTRMGNFTAVVMSTAVGSACVHWTRSTSFRSPDTLGQARWWVALLVNICKEECKVVMTDDLNVASTESASSQYKTFSWRTQPHECIQWTSGESSHLDSGFNCLDSTLSKQSVYGELTCPGWFESPH